jgi:hypothetical protein
MYMLYQDFYNDVANLNSINHSYITLVSKRIILKLFMISDQSPS